MKKFICIALLCLLASGMMFSCDKDTGSGEGKTQIGENEKQVGKEENAKTVLTGVYRSKDIVLPEGYEVPYDEAITYADGEFTFRARYDHRVNDMADFAVTKDGEVRMVSGESISDVEAVQQGYYAQRQWVMEDGTVLFTERSLEEEHLMYFSARGADGGVIFSVDIAGFMGYDLAWDADPTRVGFRVMDCLSVDGAYLVLTSEGLCSLSASGTLRWTEMSQRGHSAIAETEIGVMYLSKTGGLRTVNMSDGKLGEQIALPEEIAGNKSGDIYIGDGHDFYVANSVALWGVDYIVAEDGSFTMSSSEVISWQNSDIVYTDITSLCIADAETVLVNMRDESDIQNGLKFYISLLTKVPEEELVPKEIISLAQMDHYANLPYAVQQFNKESETHRIVVTDYSQTEEADMKIQRLNAEMAAGRVPDIIMIGPWPDSDEMLQTYVNSGVLADIIPFLQADETFAYDTLLGYVTKPYMTHDGALYYFDLWPSTYVYIAPTGALDGPITPDEMFELFDTLPEGTYLTANEPNYAKTMLNNAIENYVDWANYTCSFDDPSFAELIDRVKAIPEQKERPFADNKEEEVAVAEGKLYMISRPIGLVEWLDMKYYFGDNATPVGIPNDQKDLIINGDSINAYFTVTEASDYKAEAIDFLECLMNDDRNDCFYYESDIDEMYEEYKGKTFIYNKGKESIALDEFADNMQGDKMKLTEEIVAEYKAFLNAIDDRIHTDTKVYEIANEEIWHGDPNRTGEEIADVIQSRVSIYLAEISK